MISDRTWQTKLPSAKGTRNWAAFQNLIMVPWSTIINLKHMCDMGACCPPQRRTPLVPGLMGTLHWLDSFIGRPCLSSPGVYLTMKTALGPHSKLWLICNTAVLLIWKRSHFNLSRLVKAVIVHVSNYVRPCWVFWWPCIYINNNCHCFWSHY